MSFNWLSVGASPYLNLSAGLPGYLVALVYLALSASVAFRYRKDSRRFSGREMAALAVLLIATPLLARIFLFQVESPGVLLGVIFPLLGLLTTLLAATRGGPLVGMSVGFVNGLCVALFDTHRITQPFETALAGAAIGAMIDQRYTGKIAAWLRQPLLAALIGGVLVEWPLRWLGVFMTDFSPPLESLDRSISQLLPALGGILIASLIAGALVQVVVMRWPALRASSGQPMETAPWQKRLNARIFFAFLPVGAAAVIVLVGAVAAAAYSVSTNLVIEQMGRNAINASNGIPYFVQEGRSLIHNLADDERLLAADSGQRQGRLEAGQKSMAYFQQLALVNADGRVVNVAPDSDLNAITLSVDEQARLKMALDEGSTAELVASDPNGAMMIFVAPITDPSTGKIGGALLGRTQMRSAPALAPVVGTLLQGTTSSGEGFLVDNQNRILFYPSRPELEQTTFALGAALETLSIDSEGKVFRQTQPDGSRRLIYMLPVSGQVDWLVVLVAPNQVTLALAAQFVLPMLLLLLALIGVTIPTALALTRSITRPLNDLFQSADLIAQDQLDRAALAQGEDEIGRLGAAFEQMRLRLKDRLSEQDRLLQVSRAVSSNLELFRAMPPILSGALDVTRAASVRIALRQGDKPLQTYAAGEIAAGMATLDDSLIDLVEKEGTIIISQIARATPSLNVASLPATVRSLAALPLRSDTSFFGVLWLTYEHEHAFEQSELTFLATLAGQAAVAVANARLLAEAEEGRRKLEAVLESASDGLIAVDNQGKIVLMNPAAEKHFGVRFEQARGRPAQDIIHTPELAALLTNLQEPAASLELAGRQGGTLLANTSTMVGHDGAIAGRVTLLRDISALKELDNIKTVFLRMVSHDMRSPLTYMRGYLSILPLSGDLNEVQLEAINKINGGIERIAEMTERLLYLSRLQFGDDAELEFALVDVKELIDEIESEQASAASDKNIKLSLEIPDRLPLLFVDGMLMHQAVGNLISNAIKYTPDGGLVTVRATPEPPGSITITIADTGIGIREEDQSRLFEAFYRVPQREGEKSRPQGTGLGLALVKAIAEAHDGAVRVESAFGAGSQFHVTVPVKKPDKF